MKKLTQSFIILVGLGMLALPANGQTFVIQSSPGLFTPSFRDNTNADLGNTTWWGWSPGSFDQPVDNELVDNPPVTLGIGGLDGTLNQVGTNDILSSSNNIYTGSFAGEVLSLGIPTNGTIGTGFTTIIVQGRTAFGGWNVTPGSFADLGGVSPTLVFANNSAGQGQFWAKYEIVGNAAFYSLDWTMPNFTSVAELTVDTQWSSSAYAPDVAVVPEPSTWLLVCAGLITLIILRWRRNLCQPKG
jgi:hypothetical protein